MGHELGILVLQFEQETETMRCTQNFGRLPKKKRKEKKKKATTKYHGNTMNVESVPEF